jgi:hypothetical protein
MLHLFQQKEKEIFIDGDDSLISDLQPELAKWGIKAYKNPVETNLKMKVVLAPLLDNEVANQHNCINSRYHVFCMNEGVMVQDGYDNTLQGSLREIIPELCRIIYRVCR